MKKTVRLTESQVRRIVTESVRMILSEDETDFAEEAFDSDLIDEIGYDYLGAEDVTEEKFCDTDFGDIQYVVTNQGRTLRMFLGAPSEVEELANKLDYAIGGDFGIYARNDIETENGYFLDLKIE